MNHMRALVSGDTSDDLNSVKNSFDLLLLDHSLKVLSTVYTARNLH